MVKSLSSCSAEACVVFRFSLSPIHACFFVLRFNVPVNIFCSHVETDPSLPVCSPVRQGVNVSCSKIQYGVPSGYRTCYISYYINRVMYFEK